MYTLIAEIDGCISEDSVLITVIEPPLFDFSGDILSGCEIHIVNFESTFISDGECLWDFGNGIVSTDCQPDPINYNAGNYNVSLTVTVSGCSSTVVYNDYITVFENPIASFSASTYDISNYNADVHFINNSSYADNYTWDFGDNSNISNEYSPSHFYTDTEGNTVITLWVYNSLNNCSDSTYLTLSHSEELIYYVPNTFTPDDDEFNQSFRPVFTEGFDPFDFHMIIFNRWGEIIFETYNDKIGWDGTYNGNVSQDGTYTWKIDFKTNVSDERKLIVGHVNIIR